MTVREMIAALARLPPDLPVRVVHGEFESCHVPTVAEGVAYNVRRCAQVQQGLARYCQTCGYRLGGEWADCDRGHENPKPKPIPVVLIDSGWYPALLEEQS